MIKSKQGQRVYIWSEKQIYICISGLIDIGGVGGELILAAWITQWVKKGNLINLIKYNIMYLIFADVFWYT